MIERYRKYNNLNLIPTLYSLLFISQSLYSKMAEAFVQYDIANWGIEVNSVNYLHSKISWLFYHSYIWANCCFTLVAGMFNFAWLLGGIIINPCRYVSDTGTRLFFGLCLLPTILLSLVGILVAHFRAD